MVDIPVTDRISVTIEVAAAMCSTGVDVVKDWIKDDQTFPAVAVGRKTLIPLDGLREWMNQRGKLRVGIKPRSSAVADIVMRNRREKKCSG